MYSKHVLYERPSHNQLQFNLGVPLTTQNLVTQFQQPSPIMVERIGGHNAIPGGVKQPTSGAGNLNVSAASSCNYSVLSEEKMARMSQLAQRNLKNMKLRDQMREKNSGPASTTHPLVQGRQKSVSNIACSRQRRDAPNKPRYSVRAKEASKNRPVGDVPTHWPKRPVSHTRIEGDSIASVSKDVSSAKKETFFPVNAESQTKNVELPQGELGKVQVEIEDSLSLLKQVAERALEEGNSKFLRPQMKGKKKEGLLCEEESWDRSRQRSDELNVRFARTLYNMRQRVKHLQREATQADLNIPTQKRHIQSQLLGTYRGVSRALHTFVQQLPYQDLTYGFPAHYSELNLLVHQLTALSSVVDQKSDLEDQNKILSILDELDGINSKWSSQYLHSARQAFAKDRKSAVSKEWVSDTKVDSDLFSKMEPRLRLPHGVSQKAPQHRQQKKQQQQWRGRPAKRALGKENRGVAHFQDKKTSLKSGKPSLAGQSHIGFVPVGTGKPQPAPSVAWEVNLGKSYMLPTNLIAQREKAQRAVELSKQNVIGFAQPTTSSTLRSFPQRPSSAPASPSRRKEVNFDLEHKPWIPAGSGPFRPRSSSFEQQRSSCLKETDGSIMSQEAFHMSSKAESLRIFRKDRGDNKDYGFRSLPSGQQRSSQISDSFLDGVEQRLFDRMMQRKVAGTRASSLGPDKMAQSLHQRDEALDITDLYVEGDSTLNDTSAVDEGVRKEAVSLMDAPTLENINLRLEDMQRKQQEIRMRWSTIKFADSKPVTRKLRDDCPPEPVMLHIKSHSQPQGEKSRQQRDDNVNKSWSEDPLLFTKSLMNHRSRGQARVAGRATVQPCSSVRASKTLVSMKQTLVERILTDRDRFDSHLKRKSHHPSGKFDPWTLMEQISDEILTDCLQDVSEEVEKINEEIANHMYKSEFMVSNGSPPGHRLTSPEPELHSGSRRRDDISFDMHIMDAGDMNRSPHLAALSQSHEKDAFTNTASRQQRFGREETRGPPTIATEPLLEDVMQLMSSKRNDESQEMLEVEYREEREVGERKEEVGKEAKREEDEEEEEEDEEGDEDDDDYEDDDDDDDDGNYSDDDFEDVSDVEL